jgi:hypothetical protein
VAYVGVQDFTAPPGTVSVPLSLLRSLHVSDGAKLRLTNVRLQKATHVVLRPLTRGWSRLPDLERRALLEFQLRKHTFLVQDSELSFSYHPHLPTFRFRVVETKPQSVVSITDADLATEILPYEPDSGMEDAEPTSTTTASASATTAIASSASHVECAKLSVDEPVIGRVSAGSVLCYEFDVKDPHVHVEIDLKSSAGEADLYVLSSADAEVQSGVCVDAGWHTWAAQSRGASKSLTLSAADPLFAPGLLQIGVRAYDSDTSFTLTVHERQAAATSTGHQLGSAAAATSSSMSSPAAFPADSSVCPTCRSVVSAKSMAMHSVQCARLNCICSQCGVCMKVNERDKHMALVHSLYTCLCGVQLQQADLIAHRRSSCALRLVSCQYCPLWVTASERGAHQFECGMLRSHCSLCADAIQRKMMRRHLVKAHGGINGKTDERDITWRDFWA